MVLDGVNWWSYTRYVFFLMLYGMSHPLAFIWEGVGGGVLRSKCTIQYCVLTFSKWNCWLLKFFRTPTKFPGFFSSRIFFSTATKCPKCWYHNEYKQHPSSISTKYEKTSCDKPLLSDISAKFCKNSKRSKISCQAPFKLLISYQDYMLRHLRTDSTQADPDRSRLRIVKSKQSGTYSSYE